MSDFRKTGDYLRVQYNKAIEVTMNQDGTGFTVADKALRKPTKNDLVYFEKSPNFCLQDKSVGKMSELRQVDWTERKRVSLLWMLMDCSMFVMCILCVCSCMATVFVSNGRQHSSPPMSVEANIPLPWGHGCSVTT